MEALPRRGGVRRHGSIGEAADSDILHRDVLTRLVYDSCGQRSSRIRTPARALLPLQSMKTTEDLMDRTHPILSVGAPMSVASKLFSVNPVSFLPVCHDNGTFATVLRRQDVTTSGNVQEAKLPPGFEVLREHDKIADDAIGMLNVVVVNGDNIVVGVVDAKQGQLAEEAMKKPAPEPDREEDNLDQDVSVRELRAGQGPQVDRRAQNRGGEGAPLNLREFHD